MKTVTELTRFTEYQCQKCGDLLYVKRFSHYLA